MASHRSRLSLCIALVLATPACASGGMASCPSPPCRDAAGGAMDAGATDTGGGSGDGGARDTGGGGDTSVRDTGLPDPPTDGGLVPDTGARDGGADAFVAPIDAGSDAGSITSGRCPAGQAMTGSSGGMPTCAPLAAPITSYVNQSCSIYFGWRDSCDGCSSAPTKWGRTSDASCETTGTDGTCQQTTLGTGNIRLYGLNPDGDVDDNDKLYVGFLCDPSAAGGPPTGTACPAGQFVTGTDASGAFTCAPVGAVAEAAVNSGCWLYFGWQDSCSGCTTTPGKWGRVHGDTCESGSGSGGTCARAVLGSANVMLYGLDVDGDLDDNDEIYLGLQCSGASSSETMAIGACPAGTLATGFGTGGSLVCTSPAQLIETTVNTQCYAYLGWRDSCDACTSVPAKWGRTNGAGACENGVGVSDVCISSPAPMFGLNPDGDVNDDDKIWVGLHCF